MPARPAVQVGLVACALGLAAQCWAHAHDVVLAFWDAQAHLDIARRLLDSTTPGLQMLGTVWLPIPHLLYSPLTQVDAWWWNGVAGGIVGLLAFVGSTIAVSDIARRRAGPTAAWVAAGVVMLNPSHLYLQVTAMTEPLLLAFLTGSVAWLDRWWVDRDDRRALLLAGAAAALAVGSRYDGWFYFAIATLMVLWRARAIGPVLRFAALPALMVACWVGYNWFYFGDPLEFQRGVWSAASQQAALGEQGLLPTRGAPVLALGYYLGAVVLTSGLVVTLLGVAGARWARRFDAGPALLLLASALAFNVIALWAGQSVIALPWTTPAGVLNVRYGAMLLPALALALGLLAAWWRVSDRSWRLPLALVVLQVGIWGWRFPQQVGALREALAIRDGDRAQMDASIWLAGHYDRGRVLVAPAVNLSPRSRIAMRDRIYPWSWELGPAALVDPAAVVDWVIVDRRNVDDPVSRAVAADTTFRRDFLRAFEQRGLEIWQRR